MRDFIQIMAISTFTGFITFVIVEALAFKDDKSGFTGMLWGLLLAVPVATIAGLVVLLVKAGRL